ncbi:uracil-DNA glycosylase, family 4 [Nitrosospira sp. Nl5]|uniref:uracil-DNA glycosylase n=1 Tax=Nitrosospira sp. Nl5 TaxID=200120 RepID=UPI00088C7931|nr:uracil-DNA glycosylase [Nitrosospira sp. Nl5]SCY04938.1 uracil-DNA glycosylase, family 4 [Nitrosospira sp. Nl5]
MQSTFSPDCRQCPRLAGFLDDVKVRYPDYHARPVPPFGDVAPKLLVVGLAPGMHGANRTGRPFTGDFAGILLYRTLHKFGYASHEGSAFADDNLALTNCRITNAVKCLPPQNKPEPSEIRQCNGYLAAEIADFKKRGGIALLALGRVAHQAALMALGLKLTGFPFAHGAIHKFPGNLTSGGMNMGGLTLYDSYHCSRYNTQTRRLTAEMFEQIFARICADLASPHLAAQQQTID